ncbi:hypothetical protein DM01DRAFT_1297529 [Hesseltinella vesiculosa]|uniref:C3H1-type domain-containing protein n=1 Tax=Hesseltinella vesiculosa TaxID=101127 RepID=A0A1X2GXF1_9FUNG|nr:hypothetical protein DM01DRAFT_1297529 [Hesseltinella vesiculosa]
MAIPHTTGPFNAFKAIESISGQIRHKRKLFKQFFFIDLLLDNSDQQEKVQVLIRCDDGSMDLYDHQECFRECRPGDRVQFQVGPPTDPSEAHGRSYTLWQAAMVPILLERYLQPEPFLVDPSLRTPEYKKEEPGQDKKAIVCKYFVSQRRCRLADGCLFLHPEGEAFALARANWLNERQTLRKEATHDPNDPHHSKLPHGYRAMEFAKWLATTFGTLDGPVLDVAGGKGELSMFLSQAFGIESKVVEPKVRKQPKYLRTRLRRLMDKYNLHEQCQTPAAWPEYFHALLDNAFVDEHKSLMASVSLLVGLHPDEATEPIVDQALRLGKPFAVVPCCVFARHFRHRLLASGEPVATTQDLIQYICEKDTGTFGGTIQTAYLNFEGKNQVVYWIPAQAA